MKVKDCNWMMNDIRTTIDEAIGVKEEEEKVASQLKEQVEKIVQENKAIFVAMRDARCSDAVIRRVIYERLFYHRWITRFEQALIMKEMSEESVAIEEWAGEANHSLWKYDFLDNISELTKGIVKKLKEMQHYAAVACIRNVVDDVLTNYNIF